jgi:PilZ domain
MNWPKLTVSNPERQYKRFSFPPELVVTCDGTPGNIPLTGPSIGVHGMFINTPAALSEGTVLNVTFRLARIDVKISVRGEVRYRVPGIGVGVEFVDISTEARHAIEKEFERD